MLEIRVMTSTFTPYANAEEIGEVVNRFESCNFASGEFLHSDHVTVALCYLIESTEEEACARMREGLMRFLKHHGHTDAYHETITVFWIKLVGRYLDRSDNSHSFVELANTAVAACDDAHLIDHFFSPERLASEGARKSWLEPDLQSLESFLSRNQ
jgi:hypothetical protein